MAASLAVLAYSWYSYGAVAGHPPLWWRVNHLTPEVSLLLAMLALACLARRDGRPPRSWLILVCAPPLAMFVTRALPVLFRPSPVPGVLSKLLVGALLLLAISALAWLTADVRPALGVALALVVSEVVPLATLVQFGIAYHGHVGSAWQWASMDVEALAVAATVVMAWMLRRRTRPTHAKAQ